MSGYIPQKTVGATNAKPMLSPKYKTGFRELAQLVSTLPFSSVSSEMAAAAKYIAKLAEYLDSPEYLKVYAKRAATTKAWKKANPDKVRLSYERQRKKLTGETP